MAGDDTFHDHFARAIANLSAPGAPDPDASPSSLSTLQAAWDRTHSDNYSKAPRMGFLNAFIGQSLLSMEGSTWHRRRRLAQPTFGHARVAAAADAVVAGATTHEAH